MESGSPPSFAPIEPAERIPIIDVLRGFALLGILLVNMELFSHPAQLVIAPMETSTAWIDRAAVKWSQRFQYGPMEWLWRSLTHLRWQPMHKPVASPT